MAITFIFCEYFWFHHRVQGFFAIFKIMPYCYHAKAYTQTHVRTHPHVCDRAHTHGRARDKPVQTN